MGTCKAETSFEMCQHGVAQTGDEDLESKRPSPTQRAPLSPQLDEPVQDEEDEKAEEQHVTQQFGLTASGQLLDSADSGTEQAAC